MTTYKTNCGSVEVLNQLRQSQELKNKLSQPTIGYRLNEYIKEGQKERGGNENDSKIEKQVNLYATQNKKNSTLIHEIDPKLIHRWVGKDRPENELGNIEDLAKGFKQVGQQVPCILRPHSRLNGEYELIVGECRWRAAKLAGMTLKSIVQNIDDRMAALIQSIENEKRNDLSDFAKGMSYSKKIQDGILNQKDLTDILGISRQQVSRLLSFRKIPTELFEAIGDFRKVSARTAEDISRLSSKGTDYVDALIHLSDRIKTGKIGCSKIEFEVNKIINTDKKKIASNKKIFDRDGRHLFTWRLDNNASPSIHFPKDIIQLLKNESISFDKISEEFKECISKKLFILKNAN